MSLKSFTAVLLGLVLPATHALCQQGPGEGSFLVVNSQHIHPVLTHDEVDKPIAAHVQLPDGIYAEFSNGPSSTRMLCEQIGTLNR